MAPLAVVFVLVDDAVVAPAVVLGAETSVCAIAQLAQVDWKGDDVVGDIAAQHWYRGRPVQRQHQGRSPMAVTAHAVCEQALLCDSTGRLTNHRW